MLLFIDFNVNFLTKNVKYCLSKLIINGFRQKMSLYKCTLYNFF